jgi:hypothetical protein
MLMITGGILLALAVLAAIPLLLSLAFTLFEFFMDNASVFGWTLALGLMWAIGTLSVPHM